MVMLYKIEFAANDTANKPAVGWVSATSRNQARKLARKVQGTLVEDDYRPWGGPAKRLYASFDAQSVHA